MSANTLLFFMATIDKYSPNPDMIEKGMTLWQLITAGGSVMIFLGILSVAATASIIYHFMNITPEKLAPQDFTENLLSLIEKKEYDKAVSLCSQQPNLISAIALKGLKKISKGAAVVEEAVLHEGRAHIAKLWKNLGYLGDMAVIAPMIGLLGTVLGMIQAFNFVAFQTGVVKPVLLAQGLAKAMITTAFGLIIAIPVMAFYTYFRGRVGEISQSAERTSSEIVHLVSGK
ncbi:MAG TPA: MotA/TolQ/ExbB proton channel family protein [Candidatus Omnitrophota bacterium]|nr:MotA/TolQ/ExbB proton channel family protein [Candidatus Omnitrophota bacterium]